MNRVTYHLGVRIRPHPHSIHIRQLSTSRCYSMSSSRSNSISPPGSNDRPEPPRDSQTLKLADGRLLGFAEYGSPTGKPVFFFHGFPSSRLEAEGILKLVPRKDLRIIAPERPGFGLSTFNPGHRVTDWPDDVRALADHLGLNRFTILGGSGGAPYALACARSLPAEMISAVGLLAPAAPWKEAGIAGVPLSSRIVALMGYYWPASLRAISTGMIGLCRWLATTRFVTRRIDMWLETMRAKEGPHPESKSTPSSTSASITSPSPTSSPPTTGAKEATAAATDRSPIPEARAALFRVLFEPFRQGTAPTVRESQLLTWEGWGFPLHEVRCDNDKNNNKIIIYHGVEDGQSPIRMARYLAAQLSHCELREFEGETHFTLAAKYLGALLGELVPVDRDMEKGKGKGDVDEEGNRAG
ncbi:Alpha/Beta hydrolase protein [Xylaria sp. FL0043]|nr:Alpha/Beta hydrolase protein [Xylaria sp. FL0043]